MIYITGDCHSDFRRFSKNVFPEQEEMTKDDYTAILWTNGMAVKFINFEIQLYI